MRKLSNRLCTWHNINGATGYGSGKFCPVATWLGGFARQPLDGGAASDGDAVERQRGTLRLPEGHHEGVDGCFPDAPEAPD